MIKLLAWKNASTGNLFFLGVEVSAQPMDDIKQNLIEETENEDTSQNVETKIIFDLIPEKTIFKIEVPTNGMTITVRQFKSCLPSSVQQRIQHAHNCRFFFKTYDKDVEGPLFKELSKDQDIVPLYEKHIRAKIDPS